MHSLTAERGNGGNEIHITNTTYRAHFLQLDANFRSLSPQDLPCRYSGFVPQRDSYNAYTSDEAKCMNILSPPCKAQTYLVCFFLLSISDVSEADGSSTTRYVM